MSDIFKMIPLLEEHMRSLDAGAVEVAAAYLPYKKRQFCIFSFRVLSKDCVLPDYLAPSFFVVGRSSSLHQTRYLFINLCFQPDLLIWILDEALAIFQQMPCPNVVSWTTMLAACAQQGQVDMTVIQMPDCNVFMEYHDFDLCQSWAIKEALNLFQQTPERYVVSWNAMLMFRTSS